MESGGSLSSTGFLSFLDHDTRPTFILATSTQSPIDSLAYTHTNPALEANPALLDAIKGTYSDLKGSIISWTYTYRNFRAWALDGAEHSWSTGGYLFRGYLWSRFVLKNQWIVISATEYMEDTKGISTKNGSSLRSIPKDNAASTPRSNKSTTELQPDTPVLEQTASVGAAQGLPILDPASSISSVREIDWTRADPERLTGHLRDCRNVDWAETPLGPIEMWPDELRSFANLIMIDSDPCILFWGPQNTMIYNEHYIQVVGDKHPSCLGTNVLETLSEYSEYLIGVFENARKSGKIVEMPFIPVFFLNEHGQLEEQYLSSKMFPIVGQNNEVVAIFQRNTYKTDEIQLQRRLAILTELPTKIIHARTFHRFCRLTMEVLAGDEKDIMAASLYITDKLDFDARFHSAFVKSPKARFVRRGHFRVSQNHPLAISELDAQSPGEGLMKYFNLSLARNERIVLKAADGTLPASLVEGALSAVFEEQCRAVIISPLRQAPSEPVFGFLVVAANPRTRVNAMYLSWEAAITGLISTAFASLMSLQDELNSRAVSEEEAVFQQATLSQKLKEKELQVLQQERIFLRFVEHSTMGIYIFTPDGKFIYRNRTFNEIYDSEDVDFSIELCTKIYTDPEFEGRINDQVKTLLEEKKPINVEIKLTRSWNPDTGYGSIESGKAEDAHRVWVMASAFPELGPDGDVVQIMGCVTDISALKYAIHMQERQTADAMDSKRRLENFIDTTNHELRNPLSAVILAGDDVLNSIRSLTERTPAEDLNAPMRTLLQNLVENGKTIIQCAKHQKRIVDDVLTASKLDSDLVEICPGPVDPLEEMKSCIDMFAADAQEARVKVTFAITPAFQQRIPKRLVYDSTRWLQVLINLLTNALKFTRFESTRAVQITLDISPVPPLQSSPGHSAGFTLLPQSYLPPWHPRDPTTSSDWGTGQTLYLVTTVSDTGRGLTSAEQASLFSRFMQASPKTHVRYGGSGLGLFISRRLAEMQGGAIGVASQAGKGSQFAFYIKVRESDSSFSQIPTTPSAAAAVGDELRRTPHTDSLDFSNDQEDAVTAEITRLKVGLDRLTTRVPESLTILLVEDNLLNQKILAKQLRTLGCVVVTANHGLEAIERIKESNYGTPNPESYFAKAAQIKHPGKKHINSTTNGDLSVVLLDWEMPVMDGLSCIQRIRQMERDGSLKGRVPVIGVTANARAAQLERAVNAGMVSFHSSEYKRSMLIP
jgi:signal transduction histidine kinase/CheY-like chemotaxis protein